MSLTKSYPLTRLLKIPLENCSCCSSCKELLLNLDPKREHSCHVQVLIYYFSAYFDTRSKHGWSHGPQKVSPFEFLDSSCRSCLRASQEYVSHLQIPLQLSSPRSESNLWPLHQYLRAHYEAQSLHAPVKIVVKTYCNTGFLSPATINRILSEVDVNLKELEIVASDQDEYYYFDNLRDSDQKTMALLVKRKNQRDPIVIAIRSRCLNSDLLNFSND